MNNSKSPITPFVYEEKKCTCGCGCDFKSHNQDKGGRCLACVNNDHYISGSTMEAKITQLKTQNKGGSWW